MINEASTEVFSPRCMASSMQINAVWSINSSEAGTMPAERIAFTVRAASSSEVNSTNAVWAYRGLAISRSKASVTMPSVPSEPVKSPFKS